MPDAKLEGRVMVLESIINTDIPAIREYMKHGVELRVENTEKLGAIQAACDASQLYQERCDKDRVTLGDGVEKVKTRVTDLETWQSSQAAAVTMRSSIFGGIGGALTLLLGYLGIRYGTK